MGYDLFWLERMHLRKEIDPYRRLQWIAYNTRLAHRFNEKTDRSGMKCSVEYRVPFQDDILREYMFSSHPFTYTERTRSKRLIRDILKGHISDEVIDAPKRGFGAPLELLGAQDYNLPQWLFEEGWVPDCAGQNVEDKFQWLQMSSYLQSS